MISGLNQEVYLQHHHTCNASFNMGKILSKNEIIKELNLRVYKIKRGSIFKWNSYIVCGLNEHILTYLGKEW